MTIVQEIYHKNIDITDLELAKEIVKHEKLEALDLWLLPQYPFDEWRRKYEYPGLLENIKKHAPDFNAWVNEQGITDNYLLKGYLSDFFANKPYTIDKKKYLVKASYEGKERMQVWHEYDKKKKHGNEHVKYEFIKEFIPYYDWILLRGNKFNLIDTFFRSSPNTKHEEVFLNSNYKLLKMGGVHPPLNGFGALLRGKKLEFVNASGLSLHGTIYFSSFGNLAFSHAAVDDLKCNELDMPCMDFENCLVRNLQVKNSNIDHWDFITSNTTGNILDSKLSYIRIFGGQFSPTLTNSEITNIDIQHKGLYHDVDFEKTYRALARSAKEAGNEELSQQLKISEFDFIRKKKTGVRSYLMVLDKMYWEYGQKPTRLIGITLGTIFLFGILFSFFPENFKDGILLNRPYYQVLFNTQYYSVVTFTTLGYGDLSPTGFLKLFAAFEALFGAITLGFLVAGLARKE